MFHCAHTKATRNMHFMVLTNYLFAVSKISDSAMYSSVQCSNKRTLCYITVFSLLQLCATFCNI